MSMDSLPTLTVDGFTTNKSVIMLKLYEYFLSSDYSQSNTFFSKVSSLKYLLNITKSSADLKEKTEDTLLKMYSRYFDTVDVVADIDETSSGIAIHVNINCVDQEGIPHRLSELISIADNNIVSFDEQQGKYYE